MDRLETPWTLRPVTLEVPNELLTYDRVILVLYGGLQFCQILWPSLLLQIKHKVSATREQKSHRGQV
jgi:hypothetical protein